MWEHRYRAVTPQRTPTGRRLYSDADIERLQLLETATHHGRSIGHVAGLTNERLIDLLRDDDAELPPRGPARPADPHLPKPWVEECAQRIERLDVDALHSVLHRARCELSLRGWVEQLVVPLLVRLGERWRDGTLRPVHEHLASSAIRDCLARFESSGVMGNRATAKLVVGTPAGQMHELGALAVAVIAASSGWSVTYLGPNLAAGDIALAARTCKARAVALSIVYPEDDPRLPVEIDTLRHALGRSVALWLGGRGCDGYAVDLARMRISPLRDLSELRRELERLGD
jgi:methanogenic corrinoid protein MtbC1